LQLYHPVVSERLHWHVGVIKCENSPQTTIQKNKQTRLKINNDPKRKKIHIAQFPDVKKMNDHWPVTRNLLLTHSKVI